MIRPMNKRLMQKLATQCTNDVWGRVRSAEAISPDDYTLAIDMVCRRLKESAAKFGLRQSKAGVR